MTESDEHIEPDHRCRECGCHFQPHFEYEESNCDCEEADWSWMFWPSLLLIWVFYALGSTWIDDSVVAQSCQGTDHFITRNSNDDLICVFRNNTQPK